MRPKWWHAAWLHLYKVKTKWAKTIHDNRTVTISVGRYTYNAWKTPGVPVMFRIFIWVEVTWAIHFASIHWTLTICVLLLLFCYISTRKIKNEELEIKINLRDITTKCNVWTLYGCDLKNTTKKNFGWSGGVLNMEYLLEIQESLIILFHV